ncbi:MAG: precorrin-4 C(11)-methyltransferase [Bacteroidales bacterium]|nr:precorrin-4 C(11)-methyltransferase [Bacteroidales bacterium]
MSPIAIIPVSPAGDSTAAIIQRSLDVTLLNRQEVALRWHDFDAFIFIGAMGICVRTIAPLVVDKHTDPAVICVDTACQHVISVLSGHIGGANDLARQVAALLGAEPVITTQSDNAGLWPLDTLAQQFGWTLASGEAMNPCIFDFVNGQPTALFLEARDEGTAYLERTLPAHVTLVGHLSEVTPDKFRLLILVSPFKHELPADLHVVHYVPKCVTAGFGLAHQASPAAQVLEEMNSELAAHNLYDSAVRTWCTIDVKADEPVVALLREQGAEVRFFTADQLATIEVPTPSETVARHVGTPSVSEAAALLGSRQGRLFLPKVKGPNWTLALAIEGRHGHIEIVGAGPGDPDLVSVRGRRFLEQADLILYAGSLVPRELTECHKPGSVVRSSADMALEEQCALMKEHYDRGHLIVRLHTGDPCIFGAIQEQMAFFDEHRMSYHITPGISSFLAAAAELRSQFTIPERTQTIILTRGEGRTPMPEREKLHLLARSQSTMCIFLSAAIVDDVQRQLLQEYPEDTPVAACYHLTWPDQRIFRGQLKDLSRIVHDHHLTLTTMLVVGEAIDNRHGLSELYNRHFTHLFRKGIE